MLRTIGGTARAFLSNRYRRIDNMEIAKVGLLRCSFRLDWAMRRPCRAGRVTGTDSRAFFIYRYYNSDLTHKNRPVRESAEGHWLTRQAASTLCGFPSSIC